MTIRTDIIYVLTGVVVIGLLAACTESDAPVSSAASEQQSSTIATVVSAEEAQIARGKAAFASCALCHTTNAGGASNLGPNLSGVLGSVAGSRDGFNYSESLKASGVVWSEEALDQYIKSPASFIPGGSMAFVGVADEEDRRALLSYLIAKTGGDGSDPSLVSDQGDDVAAWE